MSDASVLVDQTDIDRIGTTVGNYHLDSILGRGGMGTVYSGEHVYIGKKVAVKVLHPQFAKYEDAVKRFLREARAASSINHPNIVDVTDFGPTPDGGVYFVMEYLAGGSVQLMIQTGCVLSRRSSQTCPPDLCVRGVCVLLLTYPQFPPRSSYCHHLARSPARVEVLALGRQDPP